MARRRLTAEDGFSLVELLVVVVIMAVLAAIAIATYLNQAQKASRTSAISTLTTVHLAAESIRADRGTSEYAVTPAAYRAEQRAYEYSTGPSDAPDQVSVTGAGDGDWVAFAVSSRSRCYYLRLENGTPGVLKSSAETDDCVATDFGPGTPNGEWT